MSKVRILDLSESYTFGKYAELAYDSADILAEFDVTLNNMLVIEAKNADLSNGNYAANYSC
ncbi:hypothetical protein [Nostoc sp. MG11]|uniref:hypothetical protein n=1 Tax=Nostoc sp. MG11 TaxID=2721166 RepID=UPI001869265B|nr:hypothetical protein [Nostoc sp. MG11]